MEQDLQWVKWYFSMNDVRYISEAKKFSIEKKDEKVDQNKDSVDFNMNNGLFCVSDGVSGDSFSGNWSRLIVGNFMKNPFVTNDVELLSWIGPVQLEWFNQVPWEEMRLKKEFQNTEKAYRGAGATFLGGHILRINKQIILKTWAIGDCNLFIIRDRDCIFSFPLDDFNKFGNHPDRLLSISNKIENKIDTPSATPPPTTPKYTNKKIDDKTDDKYSSSKGSLIFKEFNLQKDDIIIAASDAISEWFLKNCLNPNDQPWIELCNLNNIDEFRTWVKDKRDSKNIKNDDSTLLIVKISKINICEKCEKEKNSSTDESCKCGIKIINNLKFLFKKK